MSLNEKQLMGLRRQLEEIRDRGRADRDSLAELTAGIAGASSGDLSNAPVHLGDKGTEEFLHGMGTVLLGNEESIIAEATDALQRIEAGTYGECQGCGAGIPLERLQAVPATRFCRDCAEKEQGEEKRSLNFNAGRPRSGEGILPGKEKSPAGDPPISVEDELRRGRSRPKEGAVGTPGGGTAGGGLAGRNYGHGDPIEQEIEAEMEGGRSEVDEPLGVLSEVAGGRSGGAVGGTPAGKRSRGRES